METVFLLHLPKRVAFSPRLHLLTTLGDTKVLQWTFEWMISVPLPRMALQMR